MSECLPELLALSTLDHPNIVKFRHAWIEQVTNSAEQGYALYIQSVYCNGKSVGQMFKENKNSSPRRNV
eukprot:TRINITY_DN14192_c0_g1_i1.p2 TRINITY_DN14192_c0_g1~~TRINITY_DN14192_c0_g1_i1.p2  ORF type:complete len:69 (-),score=8.66 TRINITY_DN14192_c0_g1_i1:66-272(-)